MLRAQLQVQGQIHQTDGGLIMFFRKKFQICWLDYEQYGRNKYKKKEQEQELYSSLFKVLR